MSRNIENNVGYAPSTFQAGFQLTLLSQLVLVLVRLAALQDAEMFNLAPLDTSLLLLQDLLVQSEVVSSDYPEVQKLISLYLKGSDWGEEVENCPLISVALEWTGMLARIRFSNFLLDVMHTQGLVAKGKQPHPPHPLVATRSWLQASVTERALFLKTHSPEVLQFQSRT